MPEPFTQYDSNFWVSGQITIADIARARELRIAAIVKNRPDFEEVGQPETGPLRDACLAADIAFIDLPIDQAGISAAHLDRFDKIRAQHVGILAYCRSGMRSTLLYSIAEARRGENIDVLIDRAGTGGFDLASHKGVLAQFAP